MATLYFVDNRNDRAEQLDTTFRVIGKTPELWHAETGKSESVSFKTADGRTTIPLNLEPWGTVFVIFRKATTESSHALLLKIKKQLVTVDGPWKINFQPDRGAPPSITLDKLASWSDSQETGVKYFSGSGAYSKTIDIKADWLKRGTQVWIDLGNVKNLAEVTVNGKPLGILWARPVSRGCFLGPQARCERGIGQSDQLVGQSAHWRSTAGCDYEIHLHNGEAIKGQFAVTSFGLDRTG